MSEQVPAQASPSEASPRITVPGPPSQSLREKLLYLRAKSRATLAAARRMNTKEDESLDAKKSPSTPQQVHDTPVVGEQSRLEAQQLRLPVVSPLPVRSFQPIPHTPTYPSKLGLHSENSYPQSTIALSPANLGEMEFVIPLSMNTRVKDQYISTINNYQQAVQALMKDEALNDKTLEQIRKMLERANQITTHIDLDCASQMFQEQQAADEEALWAENCSSKFKFIRHLFDAVKQYDVHIAIMAQSGRLLDILETFLRGRRVRYNRPDTVSRSNTAVAKGRLNVTLLASGLDGASYLPRPATLVIAFDGSFNAQDPQVKLLRGHLVNVGQLSPVIHLLVYGSAEHIERCLPESTDSVKRLRKIVNYMTQTQNNMGQLLPDELGAAASAEEVAAFLEVGALEKDWTFPAIRPIDGLEMNESPRQEHTNDPDNNPLPTTSPMARQSSNPKRGLDVDVNANASATVKRQKVTAKGEESHVSNSVSALSQPQDIAEELKETRERLRAVETLYTSIQNGIKMKEQKFETELAAEIARHQGTKRMLDEYTESLEELQLRFEMTSKKYRTLNATFDQSEATLATSINRNRRRSAEFATVNEKNASLEAELKGSRDALLNSTELSVAEREGFHGQIRTLKESMVGLDKKVTNLNHDLEYCREQYQTASNAAVEATTRVSELEAELTVAQRKASGEAVKLATLNQKNENVELRAEVQQLGLEVKVREDLLRRKEEELRDLKHGRTGVVTRGNSVGGKSSRGASPGPGAGGYMGGKVGGSALRFG